MDRRRFDSPSRIVVTCIPFVVVGSDWGGGVGCWVIEAVQRKIIW